MKTIDNKFEIGEECYTYARENLAIICPICKGIVMKFHVNSVMIQAKLQESRQWLLHIRLESEELLLIFGMMPSQLSKRLMLLMITSM